MRSRSRSKQVRRGSGASGVARSPAPRARVAPRARAVSSSSSRTLPGEIPRGDRGGWGAAVGQHQPVAVASAFVVAVHRGDPFTLALAAHGPILPQGYDTTTARHRASAATESGPRGPKSDAKCSKVSRHRSGLPKRDGVRRNCSPISATDSGREAQRTTEGDIRGHTAWFSPQERRSDVRAVPHPPKERSVPSHGPAGRRVRVQQRLRGDDGAALAEAAIASPVFLLMLFGVLEFGGAFRSYLTLSNMTATLGAGRRRRRQRRRRRRPDPGLDQEGIRGHRQQQHRSRGGLPRHRTELGGARRVCRGHPDLRHRHPQLHRRLQRVHRLRRGQPVPSRSTARRPLPRGTGAPPPARWPWPATNGPPDYVGVYIVVTHTYATGFFGPSITLKSTTVSKLEPGSLN